MYDRDALVDLVEDAERTNPFCACGAPMIVAEHEGGLWLECSARRRTGEGLLARVTSFDWLAPHRRRLLVDLGESLAA
jgi:hypothetical protein